MKKAEISEDNPFSLSFDREEEDFTGFPYKVQVSLRPLLKRLEERQHDTSWAERKYLDLLLDALRSEPELLRDNVDPGLVEKHSEIVGALLDSFFPLLGPGGERLGYIGKHFSRRLLYMTPALREIYDSDRWQIEANMNEEKMLRMWSLNTGRLIMGTFYGHWLPAVLPGMITIRDRQTGLEKYYKLEVRTEFVEPVLTGELPKLSEARLHELIHHADDADRWRSAFPPERFFVKGIVVILLQEATRQEVVARIKEYLLQGIDQKLQEDQDFLLRQMRRYFQRPRLELGILGRDGFFQQLSVLFSEMQASLLKEDWELFLYGKEKHSAYEEAVETRKPVVIEDLAELEKPTRLEKRLLREGFRSLLLVPVFDGREQLIGLIECGDPEAGVFSHLSPDHLRDLLPLLVIGVLQKREALENTIRTIIQQQFTNIHPSVVWRFREAAVQMLLDKRGLEEGALREPIVFRNVYPLYGQADIVGSSTHRYEAIRRDLIENLEAAANILKQADGLLNISLIRHYCWKINSSTQSLREYFSSADESQVLEFLRKTIHPFLRQLREEYPQELAGAVDDYFERLDPQLGFLYHRRRHYEESVTRLNEEISGIIEQADREMQAYLPHYFEKYSTDGVEFNLYLGQSLLPKRTFTSYHLREFRIWQLLLLCRVTRRVRALQGELPLPLNTAQLLFVYSDSLDISFRMEEKQFDVDGAYNVRYEILKKRIDKATIEGSGERLRSEGRIAIVYLHEQDRREYLEYLRYLQSEGWLTDEIEEVKLAPVQGVEGLRALRVTVAVG